MWSAVGGNVESGLDFLLTGSMKVDTDNFKKPWLRGTHWSQ